MTVTKKARTNDGKTMNVTKKQTLRAKIPDMTKKTKTK